VSMRRSAAPLSVPTLLHDQTAERSGMPVGFGEPGLETRNCAAARHFVAFATSTGKGAKREGSRSRREVHLGQPGEPASEVH
jgi:hypothetical protein